MFAGNENSFSYSLPTCWHRRFDLEGSAGNFRNSAGRSGLRRVSRSHNFSDTQNVRVTMRYVRMVEGSKRVAVEAMKLTFGKVGHVLATWPKQPPLPVAVNG